MRELIAPTGRKLERLQAHDALRASEERYRALFESMDEGYCIVEKLDTEVGEPPNFRFIEANSALAAHTGVSGVSGVVGKNLPASVSGRAQRLAPLL